MQVIKRFKKISEVKIEEDFSAYYLNLRLSLLLEDECLILVQGVIERESEDSSSELAGKISAWLVDYERAVESEGLI